MIKCDFCSLYNPITRRCERARGYNTLTAQYDRQLNIMNYCDEAAKRFLSFQRSKNTRTHTKNINVNKKSYNKKSYGKKGY